MNTSVHATKNMKWRQMLVWSTGFIGFPLGGWAARAAAGPIDSPAAALLGGAIAGAILGTAQALTMPGFISRRLAWMAASAIGMSAGLALGAAAVDYKTDVASLVAMGAVTGAVVGVTQAAVADMPARRRAAWAFGTPALWALGWLITSQVIVDADKQHAVFGSSGAIVVAALSGLILMLSTGRMRSDASIETFENSVVMS